MENHLMVLLALENPKHEGQDEEQDAVEDMEEKKHREDMEKMMLNLANSSARQEVAIAQVSDALKDVAGECKKLGKKVEQAKAPSAYDMDVLRDEEGRIYKIEVKAK